MRPRWESGVWVTGLGRQLSGPHFLGYGVAFENNSSEPTGPAGIPLLGGPRGEILFVRRYECGVRQSEDRRPDNPDRRCRAGPKRVSAQTFIPSWCECDTC
jgi:hypothetical protein